MSFLRNAPCGALGKPIVDCAMTIQPKTSDVQDGVEMQKNQLRDGSMVFHGVNWVGLKTLYMKEVRRFMKVQLQTIWAPSITTLLYLAIFTVSLSNRNMRVLGVPFADFLAPGLIIMAMIQNGFANSSFSLLAGKIQGTIVDYLMPPLSNAELLIGMVGAAITRAFLVGLAMWFVMLFWPGVHIIPKAVWAVFAFGFLGTMLVALFGVLTSIWAEKFDHNAAITNFIIAPLALLSGTFYSVERLHPVFQSISHSNPFFYIISGFRYGFLGRSDSDPLLGIGFLLAANLMVGFITYRLLQSGWKIRA